MKYWNFGCGAGWDLRVELGENGIGITWKMSYT